jgi:hypothetical protein
VWRLAASASGQQHVGWLRHPAQPSARCRCDQVPGSGGERGADGAPGAVGGTQRWHPASAASAKQLSAHLYGASLLIQLHPVLLQQRVHGLQAPAVPAEAVHCGAGRGAGAGVREASTPGVDSHPSLFHIHSTHMQQHTSGTQATSGATACLRVRAPPRRPKSMHAPPPTLPPPPEMVVWLRA